MYQCFSKYGTLQIQAMDMKLLRITEEKQDGVGLQIITF
jgi:hypothetical protein